MFDKRLAQMGNRGEDAEEGHSQEKSKGASKLADQRVNGKDQDLLKSKII